MIGIGIAFPHKLSQKSRLTDVQHVDKSQNLYLSDSHIKIKFSVRIEHLLKCVSELFVYARELFFARVSVKPKPD